MVYIRAVVLGVGGAAGLILGLIVVFVSIYGWYLFRAPKKQRNEARRQLVALKNRSFEGGYIHACIVEAFGDIRKLLLFGNINDHNRDMFRQWCADVLKYLQNNNRHQESLYWQRKVLIDNNQPSYEDVINAYNAGVDILLTLHEKLTD